jgi:hypothetical protein
MPKKKSEHSGARWGTASRSSSTSRRGVLPPLGPSVGVTELGGPSLPTKVSAR